MSKSIAEIFIEEAIKTESCNFTEIAKRLSDKRTIRLLHAATGMVDEAAEFLAVVRKHIFYGKDIDIVNLKEECGDSLWFEAIALHELGFSFEEVMVMVIQKLRKRYHEKNFSSEAAINRDLKEERSELEKTVDYSMGFGMGSKKATEIIKQELEKEGYDRRQNENNLEYGTRVHQQLEERLKQEGIDDVRIESSESNLHELTENIVDRVKMEIVDDEIVDEITETEHLKVKLPKD